ncbi:CRTAM protein, partial [Amia calva]|nr:CRTAM protein [Amia calva]
MKMAMRLQTFVLLVFMIAKGSTEPVAASVTVVEGGTLVLHCNIDRGDRTHMEWKNPRDFVAFFNNHRGLRDQRYRMVTWSATEFTISLANVTVKDAGVYKCLHYPEPVTIRMVKVTVLGVPKLEMEETNDRKIIKCSAYASYPSPRISWLFDSGLELDAQPQHHCKGDGEAAACSSIGTLVVRSHRGRVTVDCVVRHAALHHPYFNGSISVHSSSEERGITSASPTEYSSSPASQEATTQHPDTANETVASPAAVTTEWASGNLTNSTMEEWDRKRQEWNGAVLLSLVAILICVLLLVVLLFVKKLKKAHTTWKKENEDSDQSLESNKSKSSNEDKLSQERKCQGFYNLNFMKYTVEVHNETETEVKKPVGARKPEEAEKPAGAEKPAESEKPAGAEKPAESEKPAVAEKPAGAEKPAESEKPVGAEMPAGAEELPEFPNPPAAEAWVAPARETEV